MAAAADLDEIKEVNANCILMANLQQASTSGTQSNKALVYDSDGSARVQLHDNCYNDEIFNMFTQEDQYTKLLEPIPEPYQVPQNDSNVISKVSSVEQGRGTVEQHPVNVEETRAYQESLFHNLVTEVKKVNLVNRKMNETNAELTTELARYKNQEKCLKLVKKNMTNLKGKQITALNEEISILNKQLSKEKSTISSLQEEKKRLKFDFKIRKDELLDKQIQLENKIKELDNILSAKFRNKFLKEAAKFVRDFQSLAKEADESLAKHKALEWEIERLLRAVISQDIMSIMQNNSVVDTSNLQTELELDITTKTRRPHPRSNTKNDRVPSVSKRSRIKNKEVEVEEHPINFLISKNKKHISSECNNVKLAVRNNKSKIVCAMFKQCLITANHDVCVLNHVNGMNSRSKKQKASVSNIENQTKHKAPVWKPKNVGSKERLASPKPSKPGMHLRWSPTGKMFDIKGKLIASSLPKYKFLGTVRFGNDHVAVILGFGDLQWGNILITMVYFVEGLGHNLFSVGHFCDSDLEVAFRRNTCFVKNLEGVDLLKGNRITNLYTINLYDMTSASPICLMAHTTSTNSWLWHQCLSHLNFDTINNLARNDLVTGLPKFKYHKEHLCPSYEQDDYSRYTWVVFLKSKDKAPKEIKTFLKKITVLLQAPVIIVKTDNDIEFKNQVLQEYFNSVGITHQASSIRTPQQNGVVERRNRTLVEAARTMLILSRAPRKLDIFFLHVFGTLCYPKNDREDFGKLGAKAMDFEQSSLKPWLQSMTSRQISSGLDLTYAPSTITTQQPTKGEFDLLFEAMYDDHIAGQPSGATRTILAAQAPQVLQTPTTTRTTTDTAPTPINSSSQAINFQITSQEVDKLKTQQHVQHQPATIADNVLNAMFNDNTFVNPFATPSTSAAESSSSQYVDPSNMHRFYQPYPHEY
ncbi:retrovirus-related pol polyprotein from transposon TNT 1-94 [Tanacetum coccineum]